MQTFTDVLYGAVIKSLLFGARKDWVFVGCSRQADNQVMMGAAARLEGPWELTKTCKVGGTDCIYPHPWVYDDAQGELMVSWSEGKPGGVAAGRLSFEMGTIW